MSLRAATANGFTFAAILKGTAAKSYNNKINTTNSDIPLWYAPICGVTFFSPIKIIKGKNPYRFLGTVRESSRLAMNSNTFSLKTRL